MLTDISCNRPYQPPAPGAPASSDQGSTAGNGAYPHTSEFKVTKAHGTQYLAAAQSCKSCHGEDLKGGNAGASCQQCHAQYPHTADFKATVAHGKSFKQDPASCQRCHSAEPTGAQGVSCARCHAQYPHAAAFKVTSAHGKPFKQDPVSCSGCHDTRPASGAGPAPANSCRTCHEQFPHTAEFKSGGQHGRAFLAESSSCKGCHDTRENAPRDASCRKCHEQFPHSVEFRGSAAHGRAYQANGAACAGCHASGHGGQDPAVSCKKCHQDYPHAAEFKAGLGHGRAFFADPTSCARCHQIQPLPPHAGPAVAATPTSGPGSGSFCLKCHEYPHPSQWQLPANHGSKFLQDRDAKQPQAALTCLGCHGEQSAFKSRHAGKHVSCATCHPAMPHPEGFGYDHAKVARTYAGNCTACHTDLKRLMPNMGGDGCYSCHESTQVPGVRWMNPGSGQSGSVGPLKSRPSAKKKRGFASER